MEKFDNAKLIGYIESHGIEVLSCTYDTITCNTCYALPNNVAEYIPEVIAANMPAVRAYLGY